MSNKQYGLQIPKKPNQGLVAKPSLFAEESDSEISDGGGDWLKKTAKRDYTSASSKKQSKLELEKALQEDATVFQYDEVYDEMEQHKKSVSSKEKDRKPKYIQKLLVTAEKRKFENERRYERQVQKERDAEGEEFKDKETFVTSAYMKKLEEFAKLDAEQKRQDMLEDIGDVRKQQDISGFYRHLYQTTVAEKGETAKEKSTKEPSEQKGTSKSSDKTAPSRQYRKRKDSNSSVDKNKDADSNFGSSSSSSSSDSEESDNSSQSATEDPKRMRFKDDEGATIKKSVSPKEERKLDKIIATETVTKPKVVPKDVKPTPPAVDIWKKRTVGPVFDAALQRYMERKSNRLVTAS